MKTFNYRGTTINQININDFESEFEALDCDLDSVWRELCQGDSDYAYVSNGFLNALK